MQDDANFHRLRNSFMCQASDFLKGRHHLTSAFNIDPSSKPAAPSPMLAQSTQIVPPNRPGIMDVLLFLSLFAYLLRFILHLCRRSPYSFMPHTSFLFTGSYEQSYGGCPHVGYSYRLLLTRQVEP